MDSSSLPALVPEPAARARGGGRPAEAQRLLGAALLSGTRRDGRMRPRRRAELEGGSCRRRKEVRPAVERDRGSGGRMLKIAPPRSLLRPPEELPEARWGRGEEKEHIGFPRLPNGIKANQLACMKSLTLCRLLVCNNQGQFGAVCNGECHLCPEKELWSLNKDQGLLTFNFEKKSGIYCLILLSLILCFFLKDMISLLSHSIWINVYHGNSGKTGKLPSVGWGREK
ncbi:WD repeat-containing protein 89 isoform X3 [Macrotis lagotis]|uniref:WD repeat-containing protein 89 isoform X3 n=1 Tax=Macrotis lagotis TaxID=92651 RepID=UPI003D687AA2